MVESGGEGWLVFKFSVLQQTPHMNLEDAQATLERICQNESEQDNQKKPGRIISSGLLIYLVVFFEAGLLVVGFSAGAFFGAGFLAVVFLVPGLPGFSIRWPANSVPYGFVAAAL